MTEAMFPLLGPLLVFGLTLPIAALLVKLVLLIVRRNEASTGLHAHLRLRYTLLVASSGVPMAWLISAALHQAESGRSALTCTAWHGPDGLCFEAGYFALVLLVLAGVFAVPRLVREQFALRPSSGPGARRTRERIARLVCLRPELGGLERRFVVRDALDTSICTIGVLRPRVVIRTSFAEALDDDSLAAALHHEHAHVMGRDPLRYFAAWWALAVNPVGRWLLEGEFARWRLAREIHCDREAVLAGASASALAHSLVRAARPRVDGAVPALGLASPSALRLRVGLLLAYADQPPKHCCRGPALRLAILPIALAFVLPHRVGTELLDVVHSTSERAGSFLLGR